MGDVKPERCHRVGRALAISVTLMALALATGSIPSPAKAAGATLTVAPAEVAVASAAISVTVTLSNDGETTLGDAILESSVVGSAEYDVALDPSGTTGRSLPPGGMIAWTATITPKQDKGPGSATVWFRADYVHEPAPVDAEASPRPTEGPTVPGVATASLELSAGGLGATVAVVGAEGELTDQRFRPVEVHVTNDGTAPVEAEIRPHPDDMFEFGPIAPPKLTIRSNATAAFVVDVKAADSVVPGERSLVFDVLLSGGGGQTRSLVASHTVTLGVIADSQIAQLLGIPIFLFVPGVLVLLIWQLLGGAFKPLSTYQLPAFDDRNFWVLAIGLSLLFAVLYRPYTAALASVGVIGGQRDYLAGYGTRDVYLVWGTAFALTVLLYLLGRLVVTFVQRKDLKPGDSAMSVLRKLGEANRNVYRSQVSRGGTDLLALEDQPKNDNLWVSPPIKVEWKRTEGVADDEIVSIREAVRNQLVAGGQIAVLHTALKRAVDTGRAIVHFVPSGPATGAILVGVNEITYGGEASLVQEE